MKLKIQHIVFQSLFCALLGLAATIFAPAQAWEMDLVSPFLPVVDCHLDGPRKCLLDTGSRYGFVLETPASFEKDSQNHRLLGEKVIHGVYGKFVHHRYLLNSAQLGSLPLTDQEILAPLENQPESEGLPFDAVFGLPMVAPRFHIQTSFFQPKISSFESWPLEQDSLPLEITDTGHIVLELIFQGKTYKAIVDTGSSVSVVGRRFVESNKVFLQSRETGENFGTHFFGGHTLKIGNMTLYNSDLYFYNTDEYEDVVTSISPDVDIILGWSQIAMSLNGYTHTRWWFDLENKIWSNSGDIQRGGGPRRGRGN